MLLMAITQNQRGFLSPSMCQLVCLVFINEASRKQRGLRDIHKQNGCSGTLSSYLFVDVEYLHPSHSIINYTFFSGKMGQ